MQQLLKQIQEATTSVLLKCAEAIPADIKQSLRDSLVRVNNVIDQPLQDELDAKRWRAFLSTQIDPQNLINLADQIIEAQDEA